MKLNLYTAVQWFSGYSMNYSIGEQAETFTRIRMCSPKEAEILKDDVCYIERRIETLICNSYIQCRCGKDWIRFLGVSLEQVADEFLQMIDSYHDWENNLTQAVAEKKSLQEFLELSQHILQHPAAIQDNYFNILAISNDYLGKISRDWDYNYENHQFILHSLMETSRDVKLEYQLQHAERAFIYDQPVLGMKCISAPIYLEKRRLGMVTLLEHDCLFTDWDLQKVDYFVEMLQRSLLSTPVSSAFQPVSNSFQQILSGFSATNFEVQNLLTLLEWQDESEYILCKIFETETSPSLTEYLAPRIQSLLYPCAVADYERELYVLINRDQTSQEKMQSFVHLINMGKYCCCFSIPFRKLSDLPAIRMQTKIPYIQKKMNNQSSVLQVSEYAWVYLEEMILEEMKTKQICHPGIIRIWEYDKKHSTVFAETLYCFLSNERNLARTCAVMHIHRNTLIYRIQKIHALLDCNLDDRNVRHYLFYSLKMLESL